MAFATAVAGPLENEPGKGLGPASPARAAEPEAALSRAGLACLDGLLEPFAGSAAALPQALDDVIRIHRNPPSPEHRAAAALILRALRSDAPAASAEELPALAQAAAFVWKEARSRPDVAAALSGLLAIEPEPSAAESASPALPAGAAPGVQALAALAEAGDGEAGRFDGAAVVPADAGLFERALAAAEGRREELPSLHPEYLEAAIQALGITDPAEKAALVGGQHLRPVLEAGLVHQAVADALVSHGVTRREDALGAVRYFDLLPRARKRRLVTEVLEKVLDSLGGELDVANVGSLQSRANAYRMTAPEYAAFLKAWRRLQDADFESAKLAILDVLRFADRKFIEGVRRAHRLATVPTLGECLRLNDVVDWFRHRSSRRAVPVPIGERRVELVESGGGTLEWKDVSAFDWRTVDRYLATASPRDRTFFLSSHARSMSVEQLTALRDRPYWGATPEQGQTILKGTLAVQRNQRAALEATFARLRAAREALVVGLGRREPSDPIDPEVVTRRLRESKTRGWGDGSVDGMRTLLYEYASRLKSDDRPAVARAYLDAVSEVWSTDMFPGEAYGVAIVELGRGAGDVHFREVTLLFLKAARRLKFRQRLAVYRAARDAAADRPLSGRTAAILRDEMAEHAGIDRARMWEILPSPDDRDFDAMDAVLKYDWSPAPMARMLAQADEPARERVFVLEHKLRHEAFAAGVELRLSL